jgi:flagellar biosynthesis/type III secretory pathway chaperone
MNKELRERNKLEKEENNILDARITTVADLLDNINEQKQSLLQSLSYENERYTKRQRELAHANKTAQNKGISQYVWMDKNNTVQINYDEIREVTDSAKG